MSNKVYFRYLKIVLLDDEGNMKDHDGGSYGFTVYDDYGDRTNWGYDTFEQLEKAANLRNIISFLEEMDMQNHETTPDHFADEVRERGMYFNGNWYTAEYLLSIQEPDEEDDECNHSIST